MWGVLGFLGSSLARVGRLFGLDFSKLFTKECKVDWKARSPYKYINKQNIRANNLCRRKYAL